MKISDLFSAEMEPALNEWMRKFTSPRDLFLAIPQLFATLTSQNIQGNIEEGAVIDGPVHIGSGSVVHAQAIIRGPCIVGQDTAINSHTEIQSGSFIGSKCVIGHGCSIIQSMVMDNALIGAGAFVRNSIIGSGCIVGPGAALGAVEAEQARGPASQTPLRVGAILGDCAVVGANGTIKPGTIIGAHTIIGEGVLAEGTYEPNQKITFKPALDIKRRRDPA
jgi:UDP-N-acetylglucosamine diphosphorylase / glucose-1-phosphate thymidylyltransferase / UDP-N-acetylgalactosamine diphosphorylase / glucosamine-1-phosphate N-acetyltransferase / galactosamine-1-phosphate N-acetyltransferase